MTNPYTIYKPPSYPEDKAMTVAQMEAKQRDSSMKRAQSPGILICKLEQVNSFDVPTHVHPFQECMDWRHANVIADDDPWMYWWTYDKWAEIAPPKPVPPVPVIPPVGWNARVRVVPNGISQMDGSSSGWEGFTIVAKTIDVENSLLVTGGVATRIRMTGSYQTMEAY